MKQHRYENILGYPVTAEDKESCIDAITKWIASEEERRSLVCANPHSLQIARSDHVFREAILRSDLIVPDGIGMIIASRILGGGLRRRITGSDIFLGVTHVLNHEDRRYRYFFLGSTEQSLSLLTERMRSDFPNVRVVGTFSPPFKTRFTSEENKTIVQAINAASPDVLWVGMTAPKQEKWIYTHKGELNVSFIGAIGAVFDFYAGTVKRSQPWFQERGLEWLPRMLREPKRLWYRNFVSFPGFIMRVLMQRMWANKGAADCADIFKWGRK